MPEIPVFTCRTLPQRANELSQSQRCFLDAVWDQHLAYGTAFPRRQLPQVLGKRPVGELFTGILPHLLIETHEGVERCFALKARGALLCSAGAGITSVLVRLLELIKRLYEENSALAQLDNETVEQMLELSKSESRHLFAFLRLADLIELPFYLSGWSQDQATWYLTVTDQILDLYLAPSIPEFLDHRLAFPDTNALSFEAMGPHAQTQLMRAFSDGSRTEVLQSWYGSQACYVAYDRIQALTELSHPDFDCTRLISMCQELNASAQYGNAHAVIMLTRAILDHIGPGFGHASFKEVASNYSGGKSLKKALERLENHSRTVADRLLHAPIRAKEVAPTMKEVSFPAELEMVLAEFCRLLKNPLKT
jgi:hypothetical protein